jgi:hypothetical protein
VEGDGEKGKEYLRPSSIPSTNLSLTARSIFLTGSLTASGTIFLETSVVEKALAPAKRKLLAWAEKRGTVRVRKDMFKFILFVCLFVREGIELGRKWCLNWRRKVWIKENVGLEGKFSYVLYEIWSLRGAMASTSSPCYACGEAKCQKGCHELVNRMRMQPHVIEPSYSTLDFARERSLHFSL